jgi:4-hydroxybenzoate polyprenyltransferase
MQLLETQSGTRTSGISPCELISRRPSIHRILTSGVARRTFMLFSPRLRSLLASVRVANLPGVISHVWTGILVACLLHPGSLPRVDLALLFPALAACGVLLCVGGNLLNDWHDRAWDARHRPERALPAGHFPPVCFLAGGSVSLVLALLIAAACHPFAAGVCLLIVACIGIYTKWHKQSAWTVIPLALCRALLPVMAAFAVAGPFAVPGTDSAHPAASTSADLFAGLPLLLPAAALFLFVAGLSLDARQESLAVRGRNPWPARVMILLAPCAAIVFWRGHSWPWLCASLMPAGIWLVLVFTRFRDPVKARVSALLAGLPLVDAAFVLPYPTLVLSGGSTAWNGLATTCLVLPLAAFAAGRLLQRSASAT